MDIRWKRLNWFGAAKLFLVTIMVLSTLVLIPSSQYLKSVDSTFDGYEQSFDFESKYNRLVHNIVEYYAVMNAGEAEKIDLNQINSDRLNKIEENLSNTVNFLYYVENSETGEVYTNVKAENPIEYLKNQRTYAYYDENTAVNPCSFNYDSDILRMLNGTGYKIHTAVYNSLKMGDDFFLDYADFYQVKNQYPKVRTAFIASAIVFAVAYIFLIIMAGKDRPGHKTPSRLDNTYNELQIAVALFALLLVSPVVNALKTMGLLDVEVFGQDIGYTTSVALRLNILLLMSLSYVRQVKNGTLIKNTYTVKLLKTCFNTKFILTTITFLILYLVGNGILALTLLVGIDGGVISSIVIPVFALVAFNIAALVYVQKSLLSLTKIMKVTKEYSAGNYGKVYSKENISVSFRGFYEDIITIKEGLERAVQEAVKGERLKTELITNVSHDLKNPLTSIVNYVELMKKEDIREERVRNYISILDEKAARLKQLVDDLLEASKASSGNINVELQSLDTNQLIEQALGEFEDKFIRADLEVKLNTSDEIILITADGKHMWRILENLFTNVIKYSMKNTRVYVETYKKDNYGSIVIKNVSAQPLDISPEELTQRFVRGDESRSTEGTGLGLSITESLCKMQGGKFSIEIDGDLFKAIVEMPLTKSDEEI